ncbi:hypothetical protein ACQPZX_02615 [Actinoplanes sp. CA-142083]|uniref:hypothetical protein n=1 Tax=Actinoplanes sp. CA-142083 TaxID=3239903 RepID=UPI003D8ECA22
MKRRRGLISGLALTLIASALTVIGTAQAASASHFESPPVVQTGWTDSATPATPHLPDGTTDYPLGTWSDEAGGTHTSRLYVTYDLSAYEGKKMYGGTMWVEEESAADCTKRSVEVWRTKAVSTPPKWRNPPAELTKLDEIQTPERCPSALFTFDVSAAVNDAVQHKQRLVTFELRVGAEHEADPAYGRRLSESYGLRFTVNYNSLPTVDSAHLYTSGFACTQLKPYPKYTGARLEALGHDGDENDGVKTEFAIWPVGSPDASTVYTDERSLQGRVAGVTVPSSTLVQGKSYAWQARVTDGMDTSAWSKKCYFTYDGVRPSAPVVTSANFSPGTWGPRGEYPVFTFDGHGDKDIAGFQWGWGDLGVFGVCDYGGEYGQLVCTEPFSKPRTVRAGTPGGKVTLTINPDASGPQRLSVRSIDTAGNVSDIVRYELLVPGSEPAVTVEGPEPQWNQDVLIKVTPSAGITGVTEYEFTRESTGEVETRQADENGVAYFSFRANEIEGPTILVRSHSDNGFVSAPARWWFPFDPGPGVSADVYDHRSQVPTGGVGVEGTFTFSPPPGWTDVAAYRYDFGAEQTEVPAGPDGLATITWTPTVSGFTQLTVYAVRADGTVSDYPNWYWFEVAG